MIKLKGAHFLTAFLMGILFPVFLGAAELPTYQKYEGPIKPGVVITKENWDQYLPELLKLLPPAKLKWIGMGVKGGMVTMPIVKPTFPRVVTKARMEAARKYAGAARIGTNNQLLNWVAGFPFPEPKNALEIAYNFYPTLNTGGGVGHDDIVFGSWFGQFKGTKYEKYFTWDVFGRKFKGRTDIPPLGEMPDFTEKGILYREGILITEPNEVKGFIQQRISYLETGKPDDSYAYIPALRRVRRMTGADVTDPLLGSDTIPDDFEIWRQKLDSRMKFRVLEQRDFLVPRIYTLKEKIPDYDYKKHGPCFQLEWEIRPHWVLEIMINNPDYVYSKRILYMDAVPLDQGGTYCASWGETYDQKGRLWRACGMVAFFANKEGLRGFARAVYGNYQTDHYTVMTTPPYYGDGEDFDKIYPLKDEVLTIKGLLKRVR
ncbi:MAG: DUF1329 domain-containing protein [Dehalococcoidia bacterium]|nr:DUF1329 domain-containing protein [Dehalococcoidia bacterium]